MSQQESIKGYKFNLLTEEVADKDLLEDQTHDLVSENIYQLIQSSTKGVTIGLEGCWGSGKSTTINFLRKKLENKSERKNLFFMFDAWAHDGDPLRRIFLESLIKAIDHDGNDGNLKDLSSRITGKRKTVKIESTKSASKFGKLLSIFALTIPLGSVLLGKVNYEFLSTPWADGEKTIYWQFIIGLFFCASPFSLIAWWSVFGERDSYTKKIRWDFFTTDSTETSTQDVTEDGERTSIEFESYFETIIKHAVNVKKINRIVIVIDNLDRVDPPQAKNIWSTLQTFFQKRSDSTKSKDEKWEDKLWFVIPFDRDGFSKIWQISNDDSVSKSFLKKCFQIIAEVPEPVMSSWPDYVKKIFNTALNKWPENELMEAIDTFIRFSSHVDKSPTPRDIKVLANQIGLLGMCWGGKVSAEAICVYALYRQAFSDKALRKELLNDGLPENYVSLNDSKTLKMEVAGLLFGVPKEKGMQLLLTPEINLAIKNSDGNFLNEIINKHGEAFWITWRPNRARFIPTDSNTEEYKIASTIAVCNGLKNFEHKNRIEMELLKNFWTNENQKWEFEKFDYSNVLISLIESSIDKEVLLSWFKKFIDKKLETIIKSIDSPEFSGPSLPNLRKFIEAIEQFKIELTRFHYAPLGVDGWKKWNDIISKHNLNFPFVLPDKNIVSKISANVAFNNPSLNEEYLDLLLKTINIYSRSTDWMDVSEEMISWINSPSRQATSNSFHLIFIKLIETQKSEISVKIKECVKTPQFWNYIDSKLIENSIILPVLSAISMGEELNESQFVSRQCIEFWENEKTDELCTEIYNLISKSKCLSSIWILSTNSKNKLAIQILKNFSDNSLFKNPYGTWNLDEYDWASESEIKEMAEKLCSEGSFNSAKNHIAKNIYFYDFVIEIFQLYGDKDTKKFIMDTLNEMSKEKWVECLSKESRLIYCVEKNNYKYTEAVVTYFSDMVKVSNVKCSIWSNFQEIIDKCCDSETIAIPRILNSYLESEIDPMDIDDLKHLFNSSKNSINLCNKQLIMKRLIAWIDKEDWGKINQLLDLNIDKFETPLDGLLSRVSTDAHSLSETSKEAVLKIRSLVGFKNTDNHSE